MGLVNTVVPLDRLEEETVGWCREMLALSPFALRLVKASFHAHEDGYAGIQQLAHDANLLFYGSDEAREGREAYKAKRAPDFSQLPPAAVATAAHVSSVRIWLMAARLRTLPAAVAPVLVGTALSATSATCASAGFVAALLGAIFIQVGTNLSNDYSDARRGADTEDRLGPGAGDRRRARAAAPGAGRDLRLLRAGGPVRRLPRRGWRARSCSPSAPRRSSPACSTRAARARTATRASARCSCSSSSASSR